MKIHTCIHNHTDSIFYEMPLLVSDARKACMSFCEMYVCLYVYTCTHIYVAICIDVYT